MIELFRTVRDIEVIIYANNFDGDPSVGLSLGPEEVYAFDHDGNEFELTDEEVEKFGIEATEQYLEQDDGLI